MLYLFEINHILLFISGAEIVFVFFIVLLVFGADKIPSIAKIAVPKNKGSRSAVANHGKVSDDFNPFANI